MRFVLRLFLFGGLFDDVWLDVLGSRQLRRRLGFGVGRRVVFDGRLLFRQWYEWLGGRMDGKVGRLNNYCVGVGSGGEDCQGSGGGGSTATSAVSSIG